jgi:hypothetical protein
MGNTTLVKEHVQKGKEKMKERTDERWFVEPRKIGPTEPGR